MCGVPVPFIFKWEPIMFDTAIDDFCGHLNNVVYLQVATTPGNMKHQVADACASIAPDTLATVKQR